MSDKDIVVSKPTARTVYKIVVEWAAPTFYDYKTNEELFDECDSSQQRLWVVSYDTEAKEIIDWIEDFRLSEEDKALEFIKGLEKGAGDR